MRHSIRALLLTITMLAVLVSLLAMALVFNQQMGNRLLAEKETELKRVADVLKDMLSQDAFGNLSSSSTAVLDHWATVMGTLGSYRVTLIDESGQVLGDSFVPFDQLDSTDNHAARPEVLAARKNGYGEAVRYSSTVGFDVLYVAIPLPRPEGGELVLRVGASIKDLEGIRFDILKNFLWVAILGLLLSFLFSFWATKSLGQGIKELIEAASDMADGNLSRRLVRLPRNETAKIGVSLNRLASRLSRQFKACDENHQHLLAVLNNMDDGVLVTDADGRISHSNAGFLKIFGLVNAPIGYPAENIRQPEIINALDRAQRGEKVEPLLLHYFGPPERFIEIRLSILKDNTKTKGVVAVFHDLTERQKLYQMRRDFVANISHELRTPLTAIMGATETLKGISSSAHEDIKPLVDVLDRHAGRLAELARDVLELARLEALKPSAVEKEQHKVIDLFQSAVEAVLAERNEDEKSPLAQRFQSQIEPAELDMSGDFKSLATALKNLLDNALRYGEPDSPIYFKAFSGPGHSVTLSVQNQGPSIEPEDRERIFERFYRAEKSRIRYAGGAGLGLAIVKHVAQLHGGTALLETPASGGAIFSLLLPQ